MVQMRKLRCREGKEFPQGDTVSARVTGQEPQVLAQTETISFGRILGDARSGE